MIDNEYMMNYFLFDTLNKPLLVLVMVCQRGMVFHVLENKLEAR